LYYGQRHVSVSHVSIFRVILCDNKNTTVITVCLNHSTVLKGILFKSFVKII